MPQRLGRNPPKIRSGPRVSPAFLCQGTTRDPSRKPGSANRRDCHLLPEKGETSMSRKVGQIIARGERRWLVRVYLGRDRATRRRAYHNRTIYGSLRHAQAYLTRRLHERDLSRGVEGLQVTVDEFLDHWLKAAVKPKVRGKTYSDYAAMLRRYIRPAIGTTVLASLSALEIQAAYQVMIERKLSARTVRYAHAVLRAAMRQAIRWQ